MHRSFLSVSLALCGLSTVCVGDEVTQGAARFAERAGCNDTIDEDPKMRRAVKACTRLLGRSGLSNAQRGYALYARGTLSISLARYLEGLADLEEAVPLLPSFGNVLESRARAYEMNGQPAKGLADYRAALALDPSLYMAEFAMQRMVRSCPSQIYEGTTCASAGAPVPPALSVEAPAPPTTGSATEYPPRIIAADAPETPPKAAPAGQGQRFVIGPSSMFPALASPEMLPALKPGDEVEIAPYAGSPKAGDVVAFKHPRDGSTIVARRLVGLPGDEVDVRAGEVLLNGAALPRVQVGTVGAAASYQETLPNGTQYVVLDDGPNGPFDNTGTLKVPAGHYFVLGDNRDHSLDSRAIFVFGYVPAGNIVGRVQKAGAPVPTPSAPPSPVAATPQTEPTSPAEKPGWLSWLWGSKKQAAEQPPASVTPAMPPPAGGTSLTVKVGDKDIALIAPAGSCFLDSATTDGAAAVKNLQSELSTFEGLKVIAAYAPCGAGVPQFLSAIPHGGYFAVATDEDLSGRESEALQSACGGLSSTAGKSGRDLSSATDLSPKLAAMIPGIIEGDKAALRPVMDINSSTSGVPTGVFPAGPHACYMGLFRTGVVNHSDFIHADAILAFGPVVHGKFLGLVDWATFENADGIVAHLDRIKALHNDIARLR